MDISTEVREVTAGDIGHIAAGQRWFCCLQLRTTLGCLEGSAGGAALAADTMTVLEIPRRQVPAMSLHWLVEAGNPEAIAVRVLREAGRLLLARSWSRASSICLNPELIVIGGDIADGRADHCSPAVREVVYQRSTAVQHFAELQYTGF